MNRQFLQDAAWLTYVRWFARAVSVLSIGLLLLFFIGEGFSPRVIGTREWIGLLFFPFGVVVGMLVAWKREAPGSLLSIGSLVCFYIVYGFILSGGLPRAWWAFAAFTSPAFLFLLTWLVERTMKRNQHAIA